MSYPLPPELAARFATAFQLPTFQAALHHDPKRMKWWNLALAIGLLGGAIVMTWAVAMTSQELAERRGDGVKLGVVITFLLGFTLWYSVRDWKRKAYGAPRAAFVIVGDKDQARTRFFSSSIRFSTVALIHPDGTFERISVSPWVYKHLDIGAIGFMYYRANIPVEFIPLAA